MNVFKWFLIIVFSFSTRTVGLNWNLPKDNLNIARVTTRLTRDYISQWTSTIAIANKSETLERSQFNADIMDYLLGHLQGHIAVQLHYGSVTQRHWDHNIFIVDSAKSFKDLRYKFGFSYHERTFYFLIVLTQYTIDLYDVMIKIFTLCFEFEVIDANILVDHPVIGVTMFTYQIFTKSACRKIQPVIRYQFREGVENWEGAFSLRIMNFYKCPLRVVGRLHPPMLIFEGNLSNPQPVGEWENLSGIEGEILKILAKELNFTIELIFPTVRSNIGSYNFDGVGGNKVQLINKADLVVGAFSISDSNRSYFSSTRCHLLSPYMYVVRGDRNLSTLGRLMKPFSNEVWIFFAILSGAAMIVIFITRCMKRPIRRFVFGDVGNPLANLIAVLLGYSIVRLPRRNFARYLLTLWLFVNLVIRSAYQGSLYDAFRINKLVWQPSRIDELYHWKYKLILSPDMAEFNLYDKTRTIVLKDGDFLARFKDIENSNERYATVTLRISFFYYIGRAESRGSSLVMINEVIYDNQMVMYLPKHSMFVHPINLKLAYIISSGLTQFISSHYTWKRTLRSLNDQGQMNPLSIKHSEGLFKIHVLMLLITVLVFGIELLSAYSLRLRRVFDIIN